MRHQFHFILLVTVVIGYIETSEFVNCNESLAVEMYFKFPDPLVITLGEPIKLMAGSRVRKTFPNEFKVKHIMKRYLFGIWWKLPCFGKVGSCINPMPCEMFIEMGFNGTCPIQPGNYKGFHLHVPVPKFPIPWWLTDGLYQLHIEGYDDKMKEMWFCGDLTQYIKQSRATPRNKIIIT